MEIYKDILGYEGLYQVSNFGNVKSLNRIILRSDGRKRTIKEKIKEGTHNKGYKRIVLYDNNSVGKSCYVHRLVLQTFLHQSDLYVDHVDGNKQNNNLSNLRYVTNSENLTFRNTDKIYKSKHPYVYYDSKRNQYRVYKFGKRFNSFEEAKQQAICLYGQRL
jgi:hypothetical protein